MGPERASESKYLKTGRKLLKPQIEKQRRDRMNRSLETLRVLLLEESQQHGKKNRRMEKAEILEHTVSFLKKSGERCRGKEEGFSACLQRAAKFLHSRGEGQQVEAALETSISRPHARADRETTADMKAHSIPTMLTAPYLHMWNQNPHCSQQNSLLLGSGSFIHHRPATPYGNLSVSLRPHRNSPVSAGRAQTVWRPWP